MCSHFLTIGILYNVKDCARGLRSQERDLESGVEGLMSDTRFNIEGGSECGGKLKISRWAPGKIKECFYPFEAMAVGQSRWYVYRGEQAQGCSEVF